LNTCELASPRGFFLKRGVLVERVRPLLPSLCLCSNDSAGTSLSRSRFSRDEALGGGGDRPKEFGKEKKKKKKKKKKLKYWQITNCIHSILLMILNTAITYL
jgi:hypothetical protein